MKCYSAGSDDRHGASTRHGSGQVSEVSICLQILASVGTILTEKQSSVRVAGNAMRTVHICNSGDGGCSNIPCDSGASDGGIRTRRFSQFYNSISLKQINVKVSRGVSNDMIWSGANVNRGGHSSGSNLL